MGNDVDNNENIDGVPGLAVLQPGSEAPGSGATETFPSVSVVIPCYSMARWDFLLRSVASVRAQTAALMETIVVVDHNPELLARVTREIPNVVAIPNGGKQGVSGGRNTGAKASRGELVAFLDDDVVAPADWLSGLAAHLRDPDVVGAGTYFEGNWGLPAPGGSRVSSAGRSASPTPACRPSRLRSATSGRAPWWCGSQPSRQLTASARTSVRSATAISPRTPTCACGSRPPRTTARVCGFTIRCASACTRSRPGGRRSGTSSAGVFCRAGGRPRWRAWTDSARAHRWRWITRVEFFRPGVRRGLVETLRGDVSGAQRSASIVLALSFTAAGYFWYLLTVRGDRAKRA